MAGDWDCADLTGLLTVFATHVADLGRPVPAAAPPGDARAAGRRRADQGRRAPDIGRHYDLSNELFALFLDETMTYSSALFETAGFETAASRPQGSRPRCSTPRAAGGRSTPGGCSSGRSGARSACC